jgi:hypothetical protein
VHGYGDSNSDLVEAEMREIAETLAYEKATGGTWKDLISPGRFSQYVTLIVLTKLTYVAFQLRIGIVLSSLLSPTYSIRL